MIYDLLKGVSSDEVKCVRLKGSKARSSWFAQKMAVAFGYRS